MKPPLAIELFFGTGGWTHGWLARGGRVIGFDIEHLPHHGEVPAGAELVLQDVLTLHGSQFKDADVIFASPPCQKYSWLAMPWSRSDNPENSKAAKALRKEWETNGPDNRLFDACFRIQREASEAAGRYIPLIVENVLGAIEWVGRRDLPLDLWGSLAKEERRSRGQSRARMGSFHIWGDVEQIGNRIQIGADIGRFGAGWKIPHHKKVPGVQSWSDFRKPGYKPTAFNDQAVRNMRNGGVKVPSQSGRRTDVGNGARFTSRDCGAEAGTKIGGDWFSDPACHSAHGSKSSARKAASALIARIPPALSEYAAQALWPKHIPVSREAA